MYAVSFANFQKKKKKRKRKERKKARDKCKLKRASKNARWMLIPLTILRLRHDTWRTSAVSCRLVASSISSLLIAVVYGKCARARRGSNCRGVHVCDVRKGRVGKLRDTTPTTIRRKAAESASRACRADVTFFQVNYVGEEAAPGPRARARTRGTLQ